MVGLLFRVLAGVVVGTVVTCAVIMIYKTLTRENFAQTIKENIPKSQVDDALKAKINSKIRKGETFKVDIKNGKEEIINQLLFCSNNDVDDIQEGETFDLIPPITI